MMKTGCFKTKPKILKILLLITIFTLYTVLSNAYDINSLLFQYAQKADLSAKTKKESAGYLIVFTRADLDRMKIKSLKELINYIPFARYGENASGLGDVAYAPYQVNTFNPIIVYLNDRELVEPFSGNGFQLISQMDLGYIDHIEVYLGLSSYEIGFTTSVIVIKMYTKKGYRENATVAGAYYGSYNTFDTYFYQAKSNDDSSYLLYLNHRRLNRNKYDHRLKYYNKTYDLSKDKDIYDLYGEYDTKNYRLELQTTAGSMDNFIGQSWDMSVNRNNTDFYYLYGGIYYTSDDKSLKASLNYSYIYSDNIQDSDSPLGYIPVNINIPFPPYHYTYNYTYNHMHIDLEEQMSDFKLLKTFKMKSDSLLLGTRVRYKKFLFKKQELGDVNVPQSDYDTEYSLSAYFENHYFLNPKNVVVTSLKTDRYYENGSVKNMSLYSGRFGYIFNNTPVTFKTFLFFGSLAPSSYVMYYQNLLSKNAVDAQRAFSLSSELKYRHNSSVYSLLASKTYYTDAIYFNGKEYKNSPIKEKLNNLSFKYKYNFDPLNSIIFNDWIYYLRSNKLYKFYGGYVAFFNKIGKFDLFNSLSYRDGYDDQKPAFNLNSTVTYEATRNLTLYLKGNNLLNRGIGTDYMRINPLNGNKTILKRVPDFDRTVWFGVEYKF